MSELSRGLKLFFQVLAGLALGSFLLPVLFANLPFPLSSAVLYQLAWVTALLLFRPGVFLHFRILPVYLFALVYLAFIYLGLFQADFSWLDRELRLLLLSSLILQYFVSSGDFRGLARVLKFSLICATITLFTSLLGLAKYPLAARQLGGELAKYGYHDTIAYYQSRGIAGYDFFYGLVFILPLLALLVKGKDLSGKTRIALAAFSGLALLGIFRSQLTTALLFALAGLAAALLTRKGGRLVMVLLLLGLLLPVLVPDDTSADLLARGAGLLDESLLRDRLLALSETLRYGVGEGGTNIDGRAARIPHLLGNFRSNPLFGSGETLGHNFWFDRLSLFGLAGLLPWLLVLATQFKYNLRLFARGDRPYYWLVILLFLGMGLLKNMGQPLVTLSFFFLAPAMLLVRARILFRVAHEST